MLRSFPGRNFIGKSPALNVHGLKCFSVLRSPTSPVKLSQWGGAYLKSSVTERVVLQQQLLNEDSPFFGATAKMLKSSKQGLQLAMSLREDIKYCQKHSSDTANLMSKWKQFDSFLKNWLGIVFSESMLDLRQVHFSSASGEVLQYIAETEAVHPVTSVEGLKHRFGNGRRCYALFLNHGAGGGPYTLPLAYIHVGLTEHYSPSLQSVLDATEVSEPQYAIFYSVNSPHPALSGLDLASSLIKRVCGDLAAKHPSIHTYSTLSPVPAFTHWAKTVMRSIEFLESGMVTDPKLTALVQGLPAEVDFVALARLINTFNKGKLHREQLQEKELYVEKSEHAADILQLLLKVFEVLVIQPSGGSKTASDAENEQWLQDFKGLREDPQFVLISDHLVMHYLSAEKMISKDKGKNKDEMSAAAAVQLPLDPVARFHVRNGATLRRLNCLGSPASYGIANSSTYMVNYLYYTKSDASSAVITTGDSIMAAQDEAISKFIDTGGQVPVHTSLTDHQSFR